MPLRNRCCDHRVIQDRWLDHSDFVPPDLWPPNSPELNPVDYSVWSILQDKVYQHCINDFDELKHRLRAEWSNLNHAVVAAAICQWRRRLSACVKAGGGHFEHHF